MDFNPQQVSEISKKKKKNSENQMHHLKRGILLAVKAASEVRGASCLGTRSLCAFHVIRTFFKSRKK